MKKIVLCLLIILCCSRVGVAENNDKFKPEVYKTKTIDGWTIALKRFKKSNFFADNAPVVLCHGFNNNEKIWYLEEKYSLAYYLYDKGYDVWLVSLRGSGDSTKPGLSEFRSLSRFDLLKIPETLVKAALSLNKFDWNIDDHINKDIPAAIELVKKETGHEQVTWIGHSLGGMIAYAYLQGGGKGIERFIPIAAPMIIPQPPNDLLAVIRDQQAVMYLSLIFNRTVASQFQAVSAGTLKTDFDLLFYNPDNTETGVTIKMYQKAIEDVSPGAIGQLREMIASGEFFSADKQINYSANLHKVKVPILCLGGLYDSLAPPMSIHFAYNNVSSQDKSMRIFSMANGYYANYGHTDLIIGKKAPQEIYPYILSWLEKK